MTKSEVEEKLNVVKAEFVTKVEKKVNENVEKLEKSDKALSSKIDNLSKTVKNDVKKKLSSLSDKFTRQQKT